MTPWSLLLPGFASGLDGLSWPGTLADRLVVTVLFCALVDFVKLLIELLGRAEDREFESDPSLVTVVIACRNGAGVLASTIEDIRRIAPGAQVMVVDDGSTDGTANLARELGCEVHRFERSKGKAAAVNYGIYRVATPLVLLLDDDTRLGNARIPTSLITDGVADAVAFHVLPDRRNRDGAHDHNFLGSLQRYEYGKSMEIGKRFHDVTRSVSCVSGAVGLFRRDDLQAFHHRHTGVFQGEDLQRTMIHLLEGKRIVFAHDANARQQLDHCKTLSEIDVKRRRVRTVLHDPQWDFDAPRYSPDGRTVAFSRWTRGGHRDLWTVHRETGALTQLTDDRALDTSPCFSPDGRWLLWSSDRTGVANVYARELATGQVRQVTNTVLGALQPAVSPDGRTLVYVGYSNLGYDLARMPFDPSTWRDPETVTEDPFGRDQPRGPHPAEDAAPDFPVRITPYSAWRTLRPRIWSAEYTADGFGPQLAVTSQATDLLGRHAWSARVGVGLVRGDPSVDASYTYSGMRPSIRLRLYRSVDAGGGYRIGSRTPTWAAERIGGESEISMVLPARFDTHAISMTYDAQWVRALGGLPGVTRFADPNSPVPVFPFQGWIAGLRFAWSWSNAQRFTYSLGDQQGVSIYATVRVLDGIIGSAVGGIEASAAIAGYIPMPWSTQRRRHVLALHFGAGLGTNDIHERGIFAIGGFPPFSAQSWLDSFRYGVQAGGVALRGYPPYVRGGSQFELLNAEYRFPIWQTQRGPSTLPVFVQRLSGDVFMDAGNASWGRFDPSAVLVGAGAEVLADVVLGYVVPFTLRFGYARGFMTDGANQVYGLFSSPF